MLRTLLWRLVDGLRRDGLLIFFGGMLMLNMTVIIASLVTMVFGSSSPPTPIAASWSSAECAILGMAVLFLPLALAGVFADGKGTPTDREHTVRECRDDRATE